jgi:hypothetical protein
MDGLVLNDLQMFEDLINRFGLNSRKEIFSIREVEMFGRKFSVDTSILVCDKGASYFNRGIYLFCEGKFMGLDPREAKS